jgi:hypothetical protein
MFGISEKTLIEWAAYGVFLLLVGTMIVTTVVSWIQDVVKSHKANKLDK